MKKNKLIESLKKEKVNIGDLYDYDLELMKVIDENDLIVDFESFSDVDYYMVCSYYSYSVDKSIILDWNVKSIFESYEELAEMIIRYEKEARALEKKLKKLLVINK